MKILFLVYHGFSEHSGISKKIRYQIKGLRQNGHDVKLCYYSFNEYGHGCRYIENDVIKDYGKGKLAGIRQRMDYNCIYDYCIRENIELVYARCFYNANPWLINFFKKLRKAGIRTLTEIPTYPYDSEFVDTDWDMKLGLWMDRHFRNDLYKNMDAIVTFSNAKQIFGQRTINISNGIDFDSIPIHPSFDSQKGPLHLIGLAEVHYWHGFDRLISGLGEYYQKGGKREVLFHIVGGVHPAYMHDLPQAPGFQTLIDKYGISDKIVFHGTLFGKELDEVFDQCQFAIGSLARHRSGISFIKTLKNREYAARGIPFIYSEQDSDFEYQPYVIKAPADESPIDINCIINFMDAFTIKPEDIRKTVMNLDWKEQMKIVIDSL